VVEFTDEEKAKYAERLRLRAELAEKQKEEQKPALAKPATITKKKGILERVADKAENARDKYNARVKAPVGRIKNAVAPAKEKKTHAPARPARHAYSGISNRRASRRQQRIVYQQPAMRPSDIMQDSIMGQPTGRSGAAHLNDMIGLGGSGGKGGMDFMNTMINGSSSGKKKGGDFWREMLGK